MPTNPSNPQPAPEGAPSPGTTADARSPRWWLVHGGVVLAFLLFFAFVSLLYWNWLRVEPPTASLRVHGGTPAIDGAVIKIEGLNLAAPLEVTLNERNGYNERIYLQPGVYRVQVLHQDKVLVDVPEAPIQAGREAMLDLSSRSRGTGATAPAPAS